MEEGETDVTQSDADTAQDAADTLGKIETIDALLDNPDVMTALLELMNPKGGP